MRCDGRDRNGEIKELTKMELTIWKLKFTAWERKPFKFVYLGFHYDAGYTWEGYVICENVVVDPDLFERC